MTGRDWLLILVVSVALGVVWGRLGLRQSRLLEWRWADALFWGLLVAAATAVYLILSWPEAHYYEQISTSLDPNETELSSDAGPIVGFPDRPRNFGFDCSWLAVRSDDPRDVALKLGLEQLELTNWESGLRAMGEGRVFVSSAIDGWVLVARRASPSPGSEKARDEATPFLADLGARFPELLYFSAKPGGSIAWARLVEGKFVRKLALSENGSVVWNSGSDFAAESRLGWQFAKPDEQWQVRPTMDMVREIAGQWSVNPAQLEARGLPPSFTWVGD